MDKKTFMAVDQYGQTVHDLGPNPRKGLLNALGRKSASKVFRDDPLTGKTYHVGYVVAGRWFSLFEIIPFRKEV